MIGAQNEVEQDGNTMTLVRGIGFEKGDMLKVSRSCRWWQFWKTNMRFASSRPRWKFWRECVYDEFTVVTEVIDATTITVEEMK